DPEIMEQIEKETEDGFVSIPVSRLKSGNYSKASKVASTNQLLSVGRYVAQKMQTMGQEMVNGEIGIEPYKLGDKTACDYCEFQGVCGFDTKLGSDYRRLSSASREQLLEEMEGTVDKKKGE
ncbi:MAG TPA: hypothetical protein DIT54_07360, partial [Lachnospiraceae bacterium]|nr:hypothetical protein [Lachnospiraceae bacterium]